MTGKKVFKKKFNKDFLLQYFYWEKRLEIIIYSELQLMRRVDRGMVAIEAHFPINDIFQTIL